MKRLNIDMDDDVYNRLKAECAMCGVTVSAKVRELLEWWLKKPKQVRKGRDNAKSG